MRPWLYILFLVVVGGALFIPDVRPEFLLWDDRIHLTSNPFFQIWSTPYQGLYSPLLYTVWGSLWGIFAGLTWSFLLLNGVFHVVNTYLVFCLLTGPFKLSYRSAWLASVVFLAHPLQVESVAWISGFKEQFWVTWALLSLLAVYKNRWMAAIMTMIFSLLAKPTGAMIPWLALYLFPKSRLRIPLFITGSLGFLFLLWTKTLQPTQTIFSPPPLWARPLIAFDSLGFYVQKIFWPMHLSADYGRLPKSVLADLNGITLGLGFLLLGLFIFFLFRQQKFDRPRAALALFVIPLLPVLGFVPFSFQNYSTVADRYTYLPVAGLALAVGILLERRWRFAAPVAAAVLLTFAVQSRSFAKNWRTNERFFNHVLTENPQSFMAENNLGVLAQERGDAAKSLSHLERSFALNPNYAEGAKNLGAMLVNTGQFERAIAHYQVLVAREPQWVDFRLGLGSALLGHRHLEAAVNELEIATRLDPKNAQAVEQLAIALSESGRHSEALPLFEKAVLMDPEEPTYRLNLERARERR